MAKDVNARFASAEELLTMLGVNTAAA
jgi:hypothetical protein